MIYGFDIISSLYEEIHREDIAASPHWRLWREQFKANASHLLNFHGFNHHRAVSLVDNVVDMGHVAIDPENKLILIKVKNRNTIHQSSADIAFCMAIM